jgi:hypothetical protein
MLDLQQIKKNIQNRCRGMKEQLLSTTIRYTGRECASYRQSGVQRQPAFILGMYVPIPIVPLCKLAYISPDALKEIWYIFTKLHGFVEVINA